MSKLRPYPKSISSDFTDTVLWVVSKIPHGRVSSYGAIARFAGSPQASRMVGWILNQSIASANPLPAHRVVNRNGCLTGKNHFEFPGKMQKLLEEEGLFIENDKILNFQKHFWDPRQELENEL